MSLFCTSNGYCLSLPVVETYLMFQIIDELEGMIQEEGVILEYHSCDFFPKRWFDAIFVLRTDNTILYDRLQKR